MVKLFGLIFPLLIVGNFCFGQTTQRTEENDSLKSIETFVEVDRIPEFPGGMGAFYKYISKNLKYPKDANAQRIEGKVFVEFIIDSSGNVVQDEIRVLQGICKSCDEEAIRLIEESPKWVPGHATAINKDVAVRMVMPILFKL